MSFGNNGGSANGRDSRAATPSLIRKASMNSLQSANGVVPPRRSASGNMPTSPSSRPPMSPDPSRPPPPTANAIARAHFRGELEQLHGDEAGRAAETIVILHDACYGHRFSRPKTSRAALSTVVERPERIKACVLGVAAAYVLLGERHVDGEYPPHPDLNASNIPSIPFRIHKSTRRLPLTSPAVTNVHGTKWMEELKIMCDAAEGKLAMGGKELQRPEVNRGPDNNELPKKLHEGDLYLCSESLESLEGSLGAVCDAVDAVFRQGGPSRAFVAVRPPGHHCSASFPSGFCWVNNVHVGIMHAILGHGLTHAAIIDFDLHHGDGSQAIAWQHNARGVGLAKNAAYWKKASIGYFSLHDINSYPCELGDEEKVKNASLCIDNAHGQHVWNVHLEPWKTEAEFWEMYEDKYAVLLHKARKYLKAHTNRLRTAGQNSKAAIFLSAGFDASEWEGAGMQRHSVNVPTSFYARIARDVAKIAEEEGTSVQGRLISVLEGGYSDRALTSGVLSHISGLAGSDPLRPHAYNTSWWSPESLDMLESGVVLSPPAPRVQRSFTPGNYSTPTQSSTAKMADIAKLRRQASFNGVAPPRLPTPPPPEIAWNVAAHGLCTVLTPTERTTTSCSPQELTAEATRARRERHLASMGITEDQVAPVAGPAPPAPSRMGLRERKAVKSYFEGSDDEDRKKNRRRTVAGSAVLASEEGASQSSASQPTGRGHEKQAGRRLSAAPFVPETFDGASGALEPDRPSSAMTGRPNSSLSVRTTATTATTNTSATGASNPPLAVKKTRATNTAKKDAPKAPRVKKAVVTANKSGPKSSNPPSPEASRRATTKDKAGDDLDKITSGIKKITLVTKQQKEARARENQKPPTGGVSEATPTNTTQEEKTGLPITSEEQPSQQEPLSP
ncbi:Arginase/deacetylase, partial [Cryphonectria parasitica EP155]